MTTENSKLEPIDPSTATELWLDEKGTSCADSTVRNYRFRLDHFLRWCESEGIDNLNVLTGRSIQKFRLWRKEDGELNALSMRMQMSAIRVFLKWAGSIEAVDQNLYDKVRVPRVDPEDQQRDEILDADTAQAILDYLSKYQWASTEHALFAVLWQTGIRIGTAHAIDLKDVDLDEEYIRVNHRPDQGTALKNGAKGERLIAITEGLTSVLEDYIETNRHDVTDDDGRDALFTTTKGRMTRNTIRRKIYLVTAPCYRSEECPDCKGVGGDQKCPEAVSPHSIRRGSITHYLSEDVPTEVVGDRMNVSRKVLDKHYDKRSEEVKVEQRRGYLDNI